ncbi:MAG TPA: GntR family transcriptional regulator [Devosiaceae bacterium]|nr:GntR family transcriptional regulator [Devosiaceae bacterium]
MDYHIDRELLVPIRLQLKGIFEHGIAAGELLPGEPLPSVRELAEAVGVAPMTVSQVYRELKKDGLIETRQGSGTFVADSSQTRMAAHADIVALHRRIDALIDHALSMGIRTGDLGALINARLSYRISLGKRVSIVMVGLFREATASYARAIATQLGGDATVEPMTIDAILRDPVIRTRASSADLAVTFANQHKEVVSLLPNTKVVSVRFIPSEATRMALASLDPMARILALSRFSDFVPVIRSGVQRFAAHVQNVVAVGVDDPHLPELLENCDVVIFSTGAEAAAKLARPGIQSIEYRHTPDPGDVERIVVPFVTLSAQTDAADRKEAS